MEESFQPIIEQLSYFELIQLCATNLRWKEICNQPDIWQTLYLRDFGNRIIDNRMIDNRFIDNRIIDNRLFDWKTEYLLKMSGTSFQIFPKEEVNSTFVRMRIPGIIQIAVNNTTTLFLDSLGQVWLSGKHYDSTNEKTVSVPTNLPNLPKITQIAAGFYHYLFLDDQGQVWSVGKNNNGELGLGDEITRTNPEIIPNLPVIRFISANSQSSAFIDINDRMWIAGLPRISHQYLIDPFFHDFSSPVQLNLQSIEQIWAGPHYYATIKEGETKRLLNLSLPLNSEENELFTTNVEEKITVAVGVYGHTVTHILVQTGSEVWVKGQNDSKQLGFPSTYPYFGRFVKQSLFEGALDLAAGEEHSLAIFLDEQILFCGEHEIKELFLPSEYYPKKVIAADGVSWVFAQRLIPMTFGFYQQYSDILKPIAQDSDIYTDPRGYLFELIE